MKILRKISEAGQDLRECGIPEEKRREYFKKEVISWFPKKHVHVDLLWSALYSSL